MAYFYVKNGGTATGTGGRYTSAQTGSWFGTTSSYYPSLIVLFEQTSVSDGDTICISNTATTPEEPTGTLGAGTFYTNIVPGYENNVRVRVISVSNSSMDTASAGAIASFGSSKFINNPCSYYHSICFSYIFGVEFNLPGVTPQGLYFITFGGSTDTYNSGKGTIQPCIYENCSFIVTSSSTNSLCRFWQHEAIFKNCIFDSQISNPVSPRFDIHYDRGIWGTTGNFSPKMLFLGCEFKNASSTDELFGRVGASGSLNFVACTFANNSRDVFLNYAVTGYRTSMNFDRCAFHSSQLTDMYGLGVVSVSNTAYSVTNSIYGSSAPANQYYWNEYFALEVSTSIYRNFGVKNINGTNYSYKIQSAAGASYTSDFIIPLSEVWLAAHSTSPRYLYVHFARDNGASDLVDEDIYTEVFISSPTKSLTAGYGQYIGTHCLALDINRTKTPHLTDTSLWTGLTNPTRQKIRIELPSVTYPTLVKVSVILTKPSTTIYLDGNVSVESI